MEEDKKALSEGVAQVSNAPLPHKADVIVVNSNGEVGTPNEKAALMKDGVSVEPPVDRFSAVYLILMLHGIGTLMPWNMFITANSYFTKYKLGAPQLPPNCSTNTSAMAPNYTAPGHCDVEDEAEVYRRFFLQYLGITAQITNVSLNFVNVFCQVKGGNLSLRIVWCIIVIVLMFIVTLVLAMVDSSHWPAAFFFITMTTVVIINMANGIYQNSVYGTAAFLPMKYTNAVVLGSNISGTITAVISLVSLASAPDDRSAAIYYFLAAVVVLLVAFDTYFVLPFLPFFTFYRDRAQRDVTKSDTTSTRPPYWYIFKKCWLQYICVFLVFFVTLACFPAIQANIEPVDEEFIIPGKFFSGVTCFLFFNLFAVLGNITTEWIKKPGPRWVWIPITIRLLFIPFFMFCNFKPNERSLSVLITNDYVYCVGGILMAFTSGYFSSLTMMYAPSNVEPEHQGVAGMLAAFFLIMGIFIGVLFSFPIAIFIENVAL